MAAGKEEYLNSEKYEFVKWDWSIQNKLTTIITKINGIRKHHESLQQTENIVFCDTNNDNLMAYYKFDDAKNDETLMVVSLEANNVLQGEVRLPIDKIGNQPIQVHDLMTGNTYFWEKEYNFVELSPELPFHLFKINR